MTAVRQEAEGLRGRALVRPVVIAIAFGLAGLGVAWAMTPSAHLRDALAPTGALQGVDRDPIESTARGLEREADARVSLDRWEWVDRNAGIARIPIDRAIDLVVAGVRAPSPDEDRDQDEGSE